MRHRLCNRHPFWMVYVDWIKSMWMPACMDDFGTLVVIDTHRANYSLSLHDKGDC